MRNERTARGFTILELMIVVTLIGTLASIIAHNSHSSLLESRAVACEKNRVLYEDMEKQFHHDKGRASMALDELVETGYVTKIRCPQGGKFAWAVDDESLPYARQALVCSVHGPKSRIRKWIPPSSNDPVFAFSDGFDSPVAGSWNQTQGSYWQVLDGKYRAGSISQNRQGVHKSFSGDESWTDYDLNLKANLIKGNNYAVFFRQTDDGKEGYALHFNTGGNGQFRIRKVRNGNMSTVLATGRMSNDFAKRGTEHSIQLQVRGNTYTASVNGNEVVSATDGTHANGAIGVRTWGYVVAEFDDVQVEEK